MSNENTANANTTNKKVFNRIIHKGHGDVNLANYLEPEGLTPTVNNDSESEDVESLIPLPYQEKSFSNSDTEGSVKSNNSTLSTTSGSFTSTNEHPVSHKTDTNNDMNPEEIEDKTNEENKRKTSASEKEPHNPKTKAAKPMASEKTSNMPNPYVIPMNLRKPFRVPLKPNASVITPLSKAVSHSTAQATSKTSAMSDNISKKIFQGKSSSKLQTELNANTRDEQTLETDIFSVFHQENSSRATDDEPHLPKILFQRELNSIYYSPYLDEAFKTSKEALKLPPELETLESLILSQHEVLTEPIMELGTINLTLTKMIEKKNNSFQLLQHKNKIPRSLCIKCELTTSPSYITNPSFIKLKEELRQNVTTFINNGTKILVEWAKVHIKLLTEDRCLDILEKSLQILDCLTNFYIDIFGFPNWSSTNHENITLFMLKLYLSKEYFDTEDLVSYLGIPAEDILLMGVKKLKNITSDEEAIKILESLNTKEVKMESPLDSTFISEILINFDQIIKATTLELWQRHTENTKKTIAAINMKSRMQSHATIKATTATAMAIAKATSNMDYNHSFNTSANLRIANVEKSLIRQEQKTNEISKKKKQNQSKHQKNYKGSQSSEPMTSPERKALPNPVNQKQKRPFVDLTKDDTNESESEPKIKYMTSPPPPQKRIKQKQNQKGQGWKKNNINPLRKTIQWGKQETVQQFIPQYPANTSFIPKTSSPFATSTNFATGTLMFPPPPPPPPSVLPFQTQNPFSIQQTNYKNTGHINMLHQQKTMSNFQTQGLYPNPFNHLNSQPPQHNPFLPNHHLNPQQKGL